jgi:hypothetical protein
VWPWERRREVASRRGRKRYVWSGDVRTVMSELHLFHFEIESQRAHRRHIPLPSQQGNEEEQEGQDRRSTSSSSQNRAAMARGRMGLDGQEHTRCREIAFRVPQEVGGFHHNTINQGAQRTGASFLSLPRARLDLYTTHTAAVRRVALVCSLF